MRQKGQSTDDLAFRTCLGNMRYASCTSADIALLNSRVLSSGLSNAFRDLRGFEDVSIITARNSHRDAINDAYIDMFAQRRKKELHDFYAIDRWASGQDSSSARQAQRLYDSILDPIRKTDVIAPKLQSALWSLDPCQTDHHAGVLRLCNGMPVILKQNEATELCATNGAEGVVVGWDAHVVAAGREVLDTLFVQLTDPPRSVQIDGLPTNVIPLNRVSRTIRCVLPVGNLSVSLERSQVAILGNFAMTDFGSQGKTKLRNVVHMKHCRNHQAMYTALSRSTSLTDTVILDSFNATKIRNGTSVGLRAEFHDLELLDEITVQRDAGVLHSSIRGETRSELIRGYLRIHGAGHVPCNADPALKWDSTMYAAYTSEYLNAESDPEDEPQRNLAPLKRPRTQENWLSLPAAKRAVDTDTRSSSIATRDGTTWDSQNHSCAYDAGIVLLWNLFVDSTDGWRSAIRSTSPVMEVLFDAFAAKLPSTSLDTVRDNMRDLLTYSDPEKFPRYGHSGTVVTEVFEAVLTLRTTFGTCTYRCEPCGVSHARHTEVIGSYVWTVLPEVRNLFSHLHVIPINLLVLGVLTQRDVINCPDCQGQCLAIVTLSTPPAILVIEVDYCGPVSVSSTLALPVGEGVRTWKLVGTVYRSGGRMNGGHFCIRYLDPDSVVWYHDGMTTKSACVREAESADDIDLSTRNGVSVSHAIYCLGG
ncbi:hypothetical protein LXA43DRAFT_896983 [Ganoderma leucocontextum]|nr:hypothetical protein LXA43DRAFT_896983 [Ganoderma leucocontextum]